MKLTLVISMLVLTASSLGAQTFINATVQSKLTGMAGG